MTSISSYVLPCCIALILCYGLYKKVNIFDVFVDGAKEGISVSFNILPALIALMTCVGMFKASGALDVFTRLLSPLTDLLSIPKEIIPLALLRPISGSGSLVMFEDILKTNGAESFPGMVASVLQGSTETTFYVIAVYFSATKVKKTRYALFCALTADLVGFLISTACVRIFC